MKKFFCGLISFLLTVSTVLPLFAFYADSANDDSFLPIDGYNIPIKGSMLIIYDKPGEKTGTPSRAYEIAVDQFYNVLSVGGFNQTVPQGGLIIAGTGNAGYKLKKFALQKGDRIMINKSESFVMPFKNGFDPSFKTEICFNGINLVRSADTIIVYENKASTGTNVWGYEAVIDKDGKVIAVGGNDNKIPEGGYVVSAVGRARIAELQKAAKKGMKAEIDREKKTVCFEYSAQSAAANVLSLVNEAEEKIKSEKSKCTIADFDSAEKELKHLKQILSDTQKAVKKNDNTEVFICEARALNAFSDIDYFCRENPVTEVRAMWLRPDIVTDVNAVERTVKQIKELGFNQINIEVLFDCTLIFPVPEDFPAKQNPKLKGFDLLKAYADVCRKEGIELFAWTSIFRVGHSKSPYANLSVAKLHPEWRTVSNTGIDYVVNDGYTSDFLNPANEEVQNYLLNLISEIIKRDIDGVQLDYIRYPDVVNNVDYGFDDKTLNGYREKFGKDPKEFKPGTAEYKSFCDYRANIVTEFIGRVKKLIDKKRPDIFLGADIAPNLADTNIRVMQNPDKWVDKGYVDSLYTMAYGPEVVIRYGQMTVDAVKGNAFGIIGVADCGPDIFKRQIYESRQIGSDGFDFFSFSQFKAGKYIGNMGKVLSKPACSPSYFSAKSVVLQIKQIDKRMKLALENGFVTREDFDEYSELSKELSEKAGNYVLSDAKAEINSFLEFGEKLKISNSFANEKFERDFSVIRKAVKLSKDDAKIKLRGIESYVEIKNPEVSREESNNISREIIPEKNDNREDDKLTKIAVGCGLGAAAVAAVAGVLIGRKKNRRKENDNK